MQIRKYLQRALILFVLVSASYAKHPDAVGRRGVVVSGNEVASRLGLNILRRGGNAIDAAVATGMALAVIEPRAGNIGGGGFMVIRLANGTSTTIDFRERAPLAATKDMYLDMVGGVIPDLSKDGILASGVPGVVRGFGLALEEYGTMEWSAVLAPAIELAEQGYAVTYQLHHDLNKHRERLQIYESTNEIFYPGGQPLRLNSLFRQPDLAATLKRIAAEGADEFYIGRTADLIVNYMQLMGGLITLEDLNQYEAIERPTVEFDYRDVTIIGMGPPSSGTVVLAEIFNQLEATDLQKMGYHSAAHVHHFVEAARRAYADRSFYMGDPDFIDVPVAQLTSDQFAAERWKSFNPNWASDSEKIGYGQVDMVHESDQTTHYSVVDRWGNAVSVSTTINELYGSGVVVAGAGFLLNNEMDDFTIKEGHLNAYNLKQGQENMIAPSKRMVSSMTPVIVTRGDQLFMVTGSPGGAKVISTVAQVISNVVDFKMPIKDAVESLRIHHQWIPNEIVIEPYALSEETRQRLTRMGHSIRALDVGTGAANSIWVDPANGWRHGAADSRGETGAAAY